MTTASERDVQLLNAIGEILTFSGVDIKATVGRNVERLTSDTSDLYDVSRQTFTFMLLHSDFLARSIVKGTLFTYTNQNNIPYIFKVNSFEDNLQGWVKLNAELQ